MNKPVAYVDPIWIDRPDLVMSHQIEIGKLFARTQFTNYVPLYTQYQLEEARKLGMQQERALWNLSESTQKIMNTHPADLTNEEISDAWAKSQEDGIAVQQGFTTQQHYFAHLILRKASEK